MNYEDLVKDVDLVPLSTEYMEIYGVNINLQRSIPMVADGLKLVIRRCLYQMWKNYRNTGVKAAVLNGDILKIHPHGELALSGVVARLCQTFSNNVPLLTSTSNTGNPTSGDDYASPRYIENVRLTEFAKEIFFSEFDGKVNMRQSSDVNLMEPFVLPCKFPIILLNGTSGIGYTLSTDIHPYNLNEIADATIKLLKNPSAKVNLIPDSPTCCDIIVKDENTFVMQSSFDVDSVNYVITFKNTPYLKYLDDIDKILREIQISDNPIKEILSADDESELDIGKLKYVIRCKPCNLYNVINTLFKRVPGFRATISTKNMVVVDPTFRTKKYDIRQILCSWIKDRLVSKRGWFLRQLVAKNTEFNMLEGKAFMLSPKNLEKTIKIFRDCKTRVDIVPSLMKAYPDNVSSSQANYMIEVKMYQLTKEEYNKTLEQMKKVSEEIEYIRGIVEDPEKIKNVIIDELKSIKQKYGYPRRSKILNTGKDEVVNIGVVQIFDNGAVMFSETENPEHLSSDVIPVSGNNVCLIDEKGYFLWVNTDKVIHDKPMTLTSIGKNSMGKCVSVISNPDNDIVIMTNKGRIKYMPVSRIPSNATRKPLVPLEDDELIVSLIELYDENQDMFVYTNDGYGKRFQVSDLNKVMTVDAQGQFLLDNTVSGMFTINPNKPLLVYVTRLGRIRVNQSKYLSTVKKNGPLKPIIKLSQQDDLIAVFCVDKDQSITLNHADGRISTVNIDSIEPTTMATPPTRPKHVPGVKLIRATIS